jgi:hypothetical protein
VIAIDRTGSMCDTKDAGSFCTDLDNAKDGVQTLLGIMNPPYAQIGMVAFPPVQTTSTSPCSAPYNSLDNGWDGYDAAGRGYLTDTLNGSYKTSDGKLDPASGLVVHTTDGKSNSCIQAGGSTSYTEALRQSEAELVAHGRPNVPDYIVFLTDGEANMGSVYTKTGGTYPVGNADDQQPCQSAINLAASYKKLGVKIYSIGYALGANVDCTAGQFGKMNNGNWQTCTPFSTGCEHHQGAANNAESPELTSYNTLSTIASTGDFYNKASPGDLNSIFAAIATDIGQGSSRLVDDSF